MVPNDLMINPRPHLHPGVDSDQVLTVAVDEVSEWASHLGVDGQEDGDLHEGDQVQGASLVAEEELLVAEHLGQNLEDEQTRLMREHILTLFWFLHDRSTLLRAKNIALPSSLTTLVYFTMEEPSVGF